MAEPIPFVPADFSKPGVLKLTIAGQEFEVARFTSSFAKNEMPSAQCLLAVGRDALDTSRRAKVHEAGKALKTMAKAVVTFAPEGQYDELADWPGAQVVFEGYFCGFAYRKALDKVSVVANLTHWLADLSCSTCVTKNSHPANPTQFTAAAVMNHYGGGGTHQPAYVSELTGHPVVSTDVAADLWGALRKLFLAVCTVEATPFGPPDGCLVGDGGDVQQNDRAIRALNRMTGTGYDVPLSLGGASELIQDAVGVGLLHETVASYASTNFWDKIVVGVAPQFQLALVPLVDKALVIADVPALRGDPWKTVYPEEYDEFTMSAHLDWPLRAVGVLVEWEAGTFASQDDPAGAAANVPLTGGCFVSDAQEDADGTIMYVRPPAWLTGLPVTGQYAAFTDGLQAEAPTPTAEAPGATAPAPPDPKPPAFTAVGNPYFSKYAHGVYVANVLRGRTGGLSGKLRFDIAPGSNIRIKGSPERFIAGADDLGLDLYAHVVRVNITIDAEAAQAGTSFDLTHVRNEAENASGRTSVAAHPLLGSSIHGGGKHGAPLVPAYDL